MFFSFFHCFIHNLRLLEINSVVSSSGPMRIKEEEEVVVEEAIAAEGLVEEELFWAMMVFALNVNSMVILPEVVPTSFVDVIVDKLY